MTEDKDKINKYTLEITKAIVASGKMVANYDTASSIVYNAKAIAEELIKQEKK